MYSPEAGTRHRQRAHPRTKRHTPHAATHDTEHDTEVTTLLSCQCHTTPGAEGKRRKQIAIDNVNSPLYPRGNDSEACPLGL